MPGLHPVIFGVCVLLSVQNAVSAQTLKVTTEFILFNCSSNPELLTDYKTVFDAPHTNKGVDLQVRKAVLQYLRDNAPVQRSIRSVDTVVVGQRVNKTVEIGHQLLSIQIRAQPSVGGAYPMEVQQTCENRVRPEFSSSTYSQIMRLTPGLVHMRHKCWELSLPNTSNGQTKAILFWLTTLTEQPVRQ